MSNSKNDFLKSHSFNFSNGLYVVENRNPDIDDILTLLREMRVKLVSRLPARRTHIDSFIIACVDELLLEK